jgi:hypothetical protein
MLLGNALSEPDPVARQCHLEATSSGGDRSARKKVRCELYKPVKWLLAGLLIVSDSFRRNPFLRCGGMNPSPTQTDDVWKVGVGQLQRKDNIAGILGIDAAWTEKEPSGVDLKALVSSAEGSEKPIPASRRRRASQAERRAASCLKVAR